VSGLAVSFGNFWKTVATRFRNATNILAFELLNEPFAGNFYKEPELLYPGRADLLRLQPFYDLVAPLLREGDPTRLIMFESCTWSDEFGLVGMCGVFIILFLFPTYFPSYNPPALFLGQQHGSVRQRV
jgi:endoglycosylceramidase